MTTQIRVTAHGWPVKIVHNDISVDGMVLSSREEIVENGHEALVHIWQGRSVYISELEKEDETNG